MKSNKGFCAPLAQRQRHAIQDRIRLGSNPRWGTTTTKEYRLSIELIFVVLAFLFLAHFIGDFVCQKREWAREKYRSWTALLKHINAYMLVMMFAFLAAALALDVKEPFRATGLLTLVNVLSHLVIDTVTSRKSHKHYVAYERNSYPASLGDPDKHMSRFWNVIGFDQFLHSSILILSAGVLLS